MLGKYTALLRAPHTKMVNLVASPMEKDDTQEVELEQQNDEVEAAEDVSEEVEAESTEETAPEVDDKHEEKKERAIKQRLKRKQSKQQDNSAFEKRLERLELRQEGYSDEIIDEVQALGGMKLVQENKIAKRIIEEMQEEARVKRAANTVSRGGSPIKEGKTLDDLKSMSSKEMEKYLDHK